MRNLTEHEIALLEEQGCYAEDWQQVWVSDDAFLPDRVRDVRFFGHICIGDLSGQVEVEEGFAQPCGIHRSTLRDVSIGDHCRIENVGEYMANYDIGDDCHISHIGRMTTSGPTTFACGADVRCPNEGVDPCILLHPLLTAPAALLMLTSNAVRQLYLRSTPPPVERGTVGCGVRIVGAKEILNTCIDDVAEIHYASRVSECTIGRGAYVGTDVMADTCILGEGSLLSDGAQADHCFLGSGVRMSKGFSAEHSLFFTGCEMLRGEACAALCGPFSTSHHKSTLLIAVQTAFFNAGSATNGSNHAYKMGPIHSGTLLRGAKTASGAHLLWPATIGAFSTVIGKVVTHPDTTLLPLSYIFGDGRRTIVLPGIALRSAGLWRDLHKWQARASSLGGGTLHSALLPSATLLPLGNSNEFDCARSPAAFTLHFPSPLLAQQALAGKRWLEQELAAAGNGEEGIETTAFSIPREAAEAGIRYYDLLLRLFGRQVDDGGEWVDLAGLIAPKQDVDRLIDDVDSGVIGSVDEFLDILQQIQETYPANVEEDFPRVLDSEITREARQQWLRMVRADAEREYQLGDVDEDFLRQFIQRLTPIDNT